MCQAFSALFPLKSTVIWKVENTLIVDVFSFRFSGILNNASKYLKYSMFCSLKPKKHISMLDFLLLETSLFQLFQKTSFGPDSHICQLTV